MSDWKPFFTNSYDPLIAGSIDGTDTVPHDRGIYRALNSKYLPNKLVIGDPKCTIFISRLNPTTTEETVKDLAVEYGTVKRCRLVRDILTGFSRCYAFVEFTNEESAVLAVDRLLNRSVDDSRICAEHEKERTLTGWIPRRLGGGFGGKRESGQLRFGGVDRPFRQVIQVHSDNRSYSQQNTSQYNRHSERPNREYSRRNSRDREDYKKRRKYYD